MDAKRLRIWIPSNRVYEEGPNKGKPKAMDGFNELIDSNRSDKYKGARIEKENVEWCAWYVKKSMRQQHWQPVYIAKGAKKVRVAIRFVEANGRRDYSNIIAGSKYVLDALTRPRGGKPGAAAIYDDSPKWIVDTQFAVDINPKRPGIEVIVEEVTE